MEILKIGSETLKKKTKKVEKITPEIKEIIKEMKKTMMQAGGVGLAANQVGLNLSIFIANWKGKFYTFINPEIVKKSKNIILLEEACLSVPDKLGIVPRHTWVVVKGRNQNWKEKTVKAKGILSQIFQHEIDHLNGILYIEKAQQIFEINEKN